MSYKVALLLCLAISAHCIQDSLSSFLNGLSEEIQIQSRERSVEKRQVAPTSCPVITCLNAAQKCQNPSTALCADCNNNFTQCFQRDPEGVCNCFMELYSCLQRKGGFCILYMTYVEPSCVQFAGANCSCKAPIGPTFPFSQCKYDLECIDDTVCTPRPILNERCTFGKSRCGDSLLRFADDSTDCSNATSTCVRKTNSVRVGDSCTSSKECEGSNFSPQRTSCIGGACVGVPSNGNCNNTDECGFGLFCRVSTCIPQLPPGSGCSIYEKNPCSGDYICGSEGTCIPIFSKVLGASCVPENQTDDIPDDRNECALGTFCSPVTSRCRGPWSFSPCNRQLNSTDCEAGTTCQCASNGNTVCTPKEVPFTTYVPEDCKAPYEKASACMRAASCKGDFVDPDGCGMRNCKNEINCLLACYVPSFSQLPNVGGCVDLPTFTCEDSAGSVISVVAIWILVSLLFVL